jgi:rubrerythrin
MLAMSEKLGAAGRYVFALEQIQPARLLRFVGEGLGPCKARRAGGMAASGHLSVAHIASEDDLLTVACALEAEAARRYRDLARWASDEDMGGLAQLFGELAQMEDEHRASVQARGSQLLDRQINPARVHWDLLAGFDEGRLDRPSQARGDRFLARPINPARVRWDLPGGFDEAGARSALLTPYWALAIAVRNKERAFAFYTYVAAQTASAPIRALAEDLARHELEHAAFLRGERRRAFRREPPTPLQIPADMHSLQMASATWEREVESAPEPASAHRVLARNFERYLQVVERAEDEMVVTEAQRLAEAALRRLPLVRGTRG